MSDSGWQPPAGLFVRPSRPDLSEVLPELWVGEFPRPEDVKWLRTVHQVSAVLSLQDDHDLLAKNLDLRTLEGAYAAHGILFERVPVPDNDPARLFDCLGELLRLVSDIISAHHRLYLHCNGGMNRAPTVAIAYLHRYRLYSLEAARNLIKARRPCVPYMQLLYEYFGRARE